MEVCPWQTESSEKLPPLKVFSQNEVRNVQPDIDKGWSTPVNLKIHDKSSKRISEEKLKQSRRLIPHWISENSSFLIRRTPTQLKRKPSWAKNLSYQAEVAKERVPLFRALKQKQYRFRRNVLPKQDDDRQAIQQGYSVRLSQYGELTDARKRAKSTNPIVNLYDKLRPLFNKSQKPKDRKSRLHRSLPKVPHLPMPGNVGHLRKISADIW